MSALTIFLSYNLTDEELVVIWRLQTLAAAHGLTLFVPHPQDRQGKRISRATEQMIDASNLVVAFCTRQFSDRVTQEINHAIQRGRPVLLILEVGVEPPPNLKQFSVVRFDTQQPGDLEKRLVGHLIQNK